MRAFFTFILFISLGFFVVSCKKNKEIFPPSAVMYPNKTQTGIGTVTLQAGFSGFEITERGICWGTDNNPTTSGPYVKSGSGEGNIVEMITGLDAGITLFARAYAINKGGTTYSEPISFIVDRGPQLTAGPANARSTTSVAITVQVGTFNTSGLGSYGICFATHTLPVIADGSTTVIPFQGSSYTQKITGLIPGTTYFARPFVQLPGGTFFGNEISFNTFANTIFDIDGNAYYTVKIGTQEWMASTLHTFKYKDGTPIPEVSSASWASNTGDARGVYFNQQYYADKYGEYYNRAAVMSPHGLAPTGWRIPSRADWQQLFNNAGVDSAAWHLISTLWEGAFADNRLGLSVMPTGMRDAYGNEVLTNANFWTTSTESGYYQTVRFGATYYDFIPYSTNNQPGLCVRCIKE